MNTLSIGDLKVHLHGELFIEQSHFNSNKAEPPNITTSDGDSFLSNHKCYKNWALICKIQNLECNFIKHRKQLKMNQSPQGNTFSFENNREKYSDVFQDIFSDSFLASIDILHYIYNGLAINQNTSEKQESNQD